MEQEIKHRTSSIDTSGLFNNAIFGNNTTILVGNNNAQDVESIITQGNFDALAEFLKKHEVGYPNIAELEIAIKPVDTSRNIRLGIASSLLTSALQRYYGWP